MPESQDQKQGPDIVSLIKEYISTKVELTRLTAIDKITTLVSSMITGAVVVVAMLLTFLFASITLALFLGELLNSYAAGFGIVALIYLALAVITNMSKEKYINRFLQDFMVKKIFNNKEEK
ncbi:MAG: phage holin family protein [Arcticibacter sp.]